MPDWGTVLASADVAAGKTISASASSATTSAKGGPNKIGPHAVGRGRTAPAPSIAGFSYSSAMKAQGRQLDL